MRIQVNIDTRDLEMILTMIRACDPIGFFAGKLSKDLTDQLQSQSQNKDDRFVEGEQVEFVQKKNN